MDQDDATLVRADKLLSLQPTLRHVVLACVSDIIAIEASSPDTDVGHSEPRWPTLLLTSFPPASPVGDARLIESVVHEAMHLNLSNFERAYPLTIAEEPTFSPWRPELRPVSGVLHGAYVFACLRTFFRACLRHDLSQAARRHLEARLSTIDAELGSIDWDGLDRSLTSAGRAVAELARPRR
jgi:HEXXH motif-containing protein